MAFIDESLFNALQSNAPTNFKRKAPLGVNTAVNNSTPAISSYVPPEIQQALMEMPSDREAEIPVMKDQQVQVNFTPGFNNIPSNLEESDKYVFGTFDIFSGLRHYPAAYEANMMPSEWSLMQKMDNIDYACGVELEKILLGVMNTRKTQLLDFTEQVSQGDPTFNFDSSTDTLNINKAAQKQNMYGNLLTLANANKIYGDYQFVGSPASTAFMNQEIQAQGASNTLNLQDYPSLGQGSVHESHQISVSAGNNFDGYLFRNGSIGMIENHPYDFRAGTQINSKRWTIADVPSRYTGLRPNIYIDTEATDATSLRDNSNTIMTHFELMCVWYRFYVIFEYNEDLATFPNTIWKLNGLNT